MVDLIDTGAESEPQDQQGLPQDGYITIPELPGLGLELDLDYIKSNDEA